MRAYVAAVVAVWLVIGSAAAAELGELPDKRLTPGATHNLSKAEICSTKWGQDERAVTAAMKAEVFANYGLTGNQDSYCTPHGANASEHRRCEVDHLVSRELGGADEVENLWPQRYDPRLQWNATKKDRLENKLNKTVCAGDMKLEDAQRDIADDWIALYKRVFGDE
jgi:hypothetical protein